MKHLANYIDLIPESEVTAISGTVITPDNCDRIVASNDLVFEEIPGTGNAGSFFNQSLRVVCEKLTTAQRAKYVNNRAVVLKLYDDAGSPSVWGNKNQKARVQITPMLDTDVLDFSRKTTKALY